MPNKHTAILPDGSVATRTSQNRVYTHCVAVRMDFEYAYEQAAKYGNWEVHKRNWEYFKREADPATARHRNLGGKTSENLAEQDRIAGLTLTQYRAELTGQAIEEVLKAKDEGFYEKWQVVGWNGRLDLAQKLASQHSGPSYAEVRIIEANVE